MKSPKFSRQEMKDAIPILQQGWTTDDACECTAAFVNSATVDRMKAIIQNDAFAISFQTMGQYRSAILKLLNESADTEGKA